MCRSANLCPAFLCLLSCLTYAQSNEGKVREVFQQNAAKVDDASKLLYKAAADQLLTNSNDPQLAPLLKWSSAQGQGPLFDDVFVEAGDQGSGLKLAPVDEATRVHLKLPTGQGLIATAVSPSGTAARVGICQNDILLSLGDVPLAKPDDLEKGLKAAGERPLGLIVLHHGSRKTLRVQPELKVTFGPEVPAPPAFWIGLSVSPIDPALRSHLRIHTNEGLIITEVIADGPAFKAGFKVNDILLTIGKQPLRDQTALVEAVQKNGEHKIDVEILREGSRQTISVTPERRGANARTPSVRFSNNFHVLRPGFVVQGPEAPVTLSYELTRQPVWLNYLADQKHAQASQPQVDPLANRMDSMAAEIKELRKLIEELGKTLKERR
jgi:hypothetical protein